LAQLSSWLLSVMRTLIRRGFGVRVTSWYGFGSNSKASQPLGERIKACALITFCLRPSGVKRRSNFPSAHWISRVPVPRIAARIASRCRWIPLSLLRIWGVKGFCLSCSSQYLCQNSKLWPRAPKALRGLPLFLNSLYGYQYLLDTHPPKGLGRHNFAPAEVGVYEL
jgi:hypothetical protein